REAREVSPQHRHAAVDDGVAEEPEERTRDQVERRSPHEVLPVARAHAAGPDVLLAGSHGTKVPEAEPLLVDALGDPAQQATAMAVDPVPHYRPLESPDLPEAGGAIELGHAHGHLVATHLGDPGAVSLPNEVRLAGARADPRIGIHALDEQ